MPQFSARAAATPDAPAAIAADPAGDDDEAGPPANRGLMLGALILGLAIGVAGAVPARRSAD